MFSELCSHIECTLYSVLCINICTNTLYHLATILTYKSTTQAVPQVHGNMTSAPGLSALGLNIAESA